MQRLSDYLKKFSIILNDTGEKKRILIEEIKNHINLELPKDSIQIKHFIASVTASPITKNSIFIRKRLILQALEKRGFHLTDIR